MQVHRAEGGLPIKAWVGLKTLPTPVGIEPPARELDIEREALQQLENVSKLPFIHKHIAVMPDVHAGKGATIGSVIPTTGAIIPAAVGVDIGCGMCAVRTGLKAEDLPDDLGQMRSLIENMVPHGRTNNGGAGDRGAWGTTPLEVELIWSWLSSEYSVITEKHPGALSRNNANHLGTLGTGNHFIEVCLDEYGSVWIMLHSGSRGLGNRIGSYFIELAKKDMETHFINLPDKDLAYLSEGTQHFDDYVQAVDFAQRFASENRRIMLDRVITAMSLTGQLPVFSVDEKAVNCHHNYITKERHFGKDVWVTRKGAVRAGRGDLGIIPGSMGAKSYIVQGLGNPESFCSCSHGAGRRMSRRRAKESFTVDDHIAATAGVECRKDVDVLDETPMAYKDIDQVMENQKDLVVPLYTLKQVLCVKG